MIVRAPAVAWTLLAGTGFAAAFAPLPVQLGFATLGIGGIGMAHGASDLMIVAPPRRPAFLLAYGAVSLACLIWWVVEPAVALPLFLLASAIHFGVEDAPAGHPVERVCRGLSLVATPAACHPDALARLLAVAGGGDAPVIAVGALRAVGALTAAALLIWAARRRDARLAAGTLALLILPPLVGFSLGFLILHALPQTQARQRAVGCRSIAAYLRAVAPVLLGAFAMLGVIGAALVRLDATGVRALFAGIAALAIPHLLVTPWFEMRPAPPCWRPAPATAR